MDGSFDAASDVGTVDSGDDGGDDIDGGFDGGGDDAGGLDADIDASIDMGFGDIAGPCPLITTELTSESPSYRSTRLDFGDDPFDDPEDVDQLTPGGQELLVEGTSGGSSIVSELFAYEVLARCEGATLVKSETEIMYEVEGPRTDMLIELDGMRVGVSVTRAIAFPFDDPYVPAQAQTLLMDKLSDILVSSANVSEADSWVKQILVVMAYGEMHAESLQAAWFSLSPDVTADTIVYVVVTDGMDMPLY